ncbi:ribosomal protein L7Ae/L30e/S12e/Gadd45 [Tanacetum coccineum]
MFDRDLLNEIMELQTVFDQMDAAVQQFSVDKQCLEIAKKELFLENDRLLQQIMSQDVLLTVMNYMSLIGESVNMERKRNESCDNCFNLDAELLKSQNAFNDLLKRYLQLERHCISLESPIQLNQAIFQKYESCDNQNALEIPEFFEYNDLKTQLQDKDTTIYEEDSVDNPHEKRKESQRNKDDKNSKDERKCFKCGDPNHLIGECPKLSRNYNQRAFIRGSWGDSDEDEEEKLKTKNVLWLKLLMRIESARATPKAHLPYRMFLASLFRHVMEHYPHLDNGIYDVIEQVMRPLALRQARRPRSDCRKACHSVSSTSAHHNRGSSSHQGDDYEDDGASRASTPSPTTYLNSLEPLDYQQYDIPTSSEQNDDILFEPQTDLLNQTQQMHKELRGGFKSFGKALRGVFGKKKK